MANFDLNQDISEFQGPETILPKDITGSNIPSDSTQKHTYLPISRPTPQEIAVPQDNRVKSNALLINNPIPMHGNTLLESGGTLLKDVSTTPVRDIWIQNQDGAFCIQKTGSIYGRLTVDDITATRDIQFPDKAGTMALTNDLGTIASQPANNVTITGGNISNTYLTNITINSIAAASVLPPHDSIYHVPIAIDQSELTGALTRPVGNATGTWQQGQTFQPGAERCLTAIDVYIDKVGTPTDGIFIYLHMAAPSAGSTNILSAVLQARDISAAGWYRFYFPNTFPAQGVPGTESVWLKSATTYAFSLHRTGSVDANNYYVAYASNSSYANGQRYYFDSGTSEWTAVSGEDLLFRTYYGWDRRTGFVLDQLEPSNGILMPENLGTGTPTANTVLVAQGAATRSAWSTSLSLSGNITAANLIANTYIGINNASPAVDIDIIRESAASNIRQTVYSGVLSDDNGRLTFRRARGSLASPSAVQSGDFLASIRAVGYGATQFLEGGNIRMLVSQTWTDTATGAYWQIFASPNDGTSTEYLRIGANFGITANYIINASAGISVTGNITATTYGAAAVTDTELGYIDGVTSAIQTQINGKQASDAGLTSLAGLTYVSTSFVKMTGADTFSLDTNTYSLSSHNHDGTYVPYSGATGNVDIGTYNLTMGSGLQMANAADTFSAAIGCSVTANRVITLPDATGTLALTSDLSNYVANSLYDAYSILMATSDNTPIALTIAEQTVIGRLTGGAIDDIAIGIANDNMVQIDQADIATNDYAKFTANGLSGRSYAEVLSDIGAASAVGYRYKKRIPIAASSDGALTNYQTRIVVNYAEGIDTAGNVYCGDRCQADFDDLRFTRDGITLLDYFIEPTSRATTAAIVWVENDSIPATAGTGLFMFYGNATATDVSNGVNTLKFYESFDGLNTADLNGQNGWTGHANFDVQTTTTKDGAKAVQSASGGATVSVAHAITVTSYKCWVEYWVRTSDVTKASAAQVYFKEGANFITGVSIGASKFQHLRTGGWQDLGTAAVNNTWYKVRIAVNGTNAHKVWIDDVLQTPANSDNYTTVSSAIDTILLEQATTGTYNTFFDTIMVGNYTANDPVVGTADLEDINNWL